jgi:hypothetical protein
LQMFHLDVSKIYLVLQILCLMHVSYVLSAFRCMLQMLYPNVSKVDRVLHCVFAFFLPHLLSLSILLALTGHLPPLPLLWMLA